MKNLWKCPRGERVQVVLLKKDLEFKIQERMDTIARNNAVNDFQQYEIDKLSAELEKLKKEYNV
jgi:hypothetical protein